MVPKSSAYSGWRFAILNLMLIMMIAVPVSAGSLADTAWPKFQQNGNNTGLSPHTGPQTDTVAWTFSTAGSNHMIGQATIGPDGTVYFGGPDTSLYAVNPDGTLKWTYATMAKIQNAPAVGSDGTIFFGSYNADKNVYALNPDGTLKWKSALNNGVEWSSFAIADDGTLYIGDYSGYLYALNPDGTRKWVYSSGRAIESTPAIGPDGTIYFSNKKAGGFNIYALNPDGTKKWYFATAAAVDSSLSIGSDGTLYVGSHNGKVFALNPDGTKKWEISINGYLYATPAIGSDGTIYVGSSTKYMKAINPDGTLKWSTLTGGVIQGSAAIGADGTIYFGCGDNKVYALNPDGSRKWTYLTGGAVYATPSIGADGTLYVGSDDLNLYAFRDPVPPVAAFTSDVQTGIAPLTVQFTDASTNWPTSWAWDFGDGGSSTDRNPSHQYTTAGTYTVKLTAANAAGSDDEEKTDYITVIDVPVADFTSDVQTGAAPLTVTFTDLSTNTPTSWLWDFGDGGSSSDQNPGHEYTAAGIYTVTLTATNSAGSDDEEKTDYITVIDVPVADFTSDVQTGIAPLTVTFTDLSTNTPTSWLWDFGDGGSSSDQNPGHEYTAAGIYTVTLTATNSAGSDDEEKTDYIMVIDVPVADFTSDVQTGIAPLTVTFTDQSTNTPTSWHWDFGDGGSSTDQNPGHEYTAAGIYTVTLTATNLAGSDEETKTDYITVERALIPLPGYTDPPTDPDSDGIYEDLNGNGRLDFADIVLFFNEMEWIAANEPIAAFDLNGNGRIDFADIVALFNEI